jgi:hypothetical protein
MGIKPIFIIILLFPLFLFAQNSKQNQTPTAQKVVRAYHAHEPIKLDGILNEKVWHEPGISDFVQSDPIDGSEPTEKTVVWVAYDDNSLYVAARLYDSEFQLITSRLGRRDDFLQSDWFIFAVDPYYDRRTGFQFAVNPAGSIVDWYLYNDEWNDSNWDGVWDWKTMIDKKGWTVEIRIPFNQLRFAKKNEYIWGVNFRRIIKRKNENVGFIWIPKEDSGYVSHFGKLLGIKNINPGRHIELLPYAVGQAEYSPGEDGNPFDTGKKHLGNAGFDLKVGLKSNLTLDATVNPDFGQVEVDPAVINLSAYETYYDEKRPFFIEGSSIFDNFGEGGVEGSPRLGWINPTFFYSRRIGRVPQADVTHDGYINFPDRTSILGAFKLTGKVGKGWNIGAISVLTEKEYAEIDSEGERFKEEVEPFSYYGVLRTQKEFRKGRHGLGFIATSVIRDLRDENLKDILNRNAFSLAVDGWTFLDKNKTWVLGGWLGRTQVAGSERAITNLQKSSLHYYQRPDATHVELDEEATILDGWGMRLVLYKKKGRFWLNSSIGALSPGFDPNDIGFQNVPSDKINSHLLFGYDWPHPGKVFRRIFICGGTFRNYDFGRNKTWDGFNVFSTGQFLNYWGFEAELLYNPQTISNDLTRGGPLSIIPDGYQFNLGINSDSRKSIVMSGFSSLYRRPTEGYWWSGSFNLRWKPKSNISFSMGPSLYIRRSELQWIDNIEDSLMTETFGTRYIFGRISQIMLSSVIRLDWAFTPKLSFQLYLQPLLSVGEYDKFKELAQPRSFEYNIFGEGNSTIFHSDEEYTVDPDGSGPASTFSFDNPDFNIKSLRGTAVLRWEYYPGSILYFAWTQNRSDDSHPGDFNMWRDLGNLLTAPGDNIFLIKLSYRWNL